ncbi:hypothetical protein Droror1_Dr00016265 [Drosera rotundifolia]
MDGVIGATQGLSKPVQKGLFTSAGSQRKSGVLPTPLVSGKDEVKKQGSVNTNSYAQVLRPDLRNESVPSLSGNHDTMKRISFDFCPSEDEEIVTEYEDVLDERQYWEHALIGFVLGDTVPFFALSNFVKRQWGDVTSPEVLLHNKGYYIFRYPNETEKSMIRNRMWFINSRPLILRD